MVSLKWVSFFYYMVDTRTLTQVMQHMPVNCISLFDSVVVKKIMCCYHDILLLKLIPGHVSMLHLFDMSCNCKVRHT